ncbi:DUF1835 domain-containing protein [Roseomonas xinghualingensis]|uniref:DUF1835 domain-containing protein n=1 Tax=Roseomonas xinghualingensis TaxID=2986475 RepID=UPI0021F13927|nr:DUF1835 domain-containing protein [Roseomonas sp. SXEYE001]MCV4205881.1 DUF1835 domain-containing protein [Roseomonas sp. SXEYE001]
MEGTASIRCGDDLRGRIPGEYFCLADPVCQGPAEGEFLPDYISRRAIFVAGHYGHDVAAVRARLDAEYATLRQLSGHERILLWFEHDLWDQAVLIRLLSLLADMPVLAGRLHLMPAGGSRVFADLPQAELEALVPEPLPWSAVEAGAEVWQAFVSPDPTALDRFSRRALPFPHLARAMRRHLQDLPWVTDGLGLTERLLMQGVADGAADEGALFRHLRKADPVFHVTDLITRDLLKRLSTGTRRLVSRDAPHGLTPHGKAILAGEARYVPAPRFQAGVRVGPGGGWWWNPRAAGVTDLPPGRGRGGLFG